MFCNRKLQLATTSGSMRGQVGVLPVYCHAHYRRQQQVISQFVKISGRIQSVAASVPFDARLGSVQLIRRAPRYTRTRSFFSVSVSAFFFFSSHEPRPNLVEPMIGRTNESSRPVVNKQRPVTKDYQTRCKAAAAATMDETEKKWRRVYLSWPHTFKLCKTRIE